ncbi:MAG: site-specific integrase [Bacteroidetes bacterium]|nr:site-specific integrase [Bacteroidota bacterium]
MKTHEMIKVKPYLFTSKLFANGEHPLYFKLSDGSNRVYISTPFSAAKKDWSVQHYFKKSVPDYAGKNRFIQDQESELRKLISNSIALGENLELIDIKKRYIGIKANLQLIGYAEEHKEYLRSIKRIGHARAFNFMIGAVRLFNMGKDISLEDVTANWLEKLQANMISRCVASNGQLNVFRHIRIVINKAIKKGLLEKHKYPFVDFKLPKKEDTTHKSLSIEQISILENYNGGRRESVLYFLFSYYAQGMNHRDMAWVTYGDLSGSVIRYRRRKTGRPVNVALNEKAMAIIDHFRTHERRSTDFIFPILNLESHGTAQDAFDRCESHRRYVNKTLKRVAKLLGLPDWIHFYCARHSYAHNLYLSGFSSEMLGDALGHKDAAITKVYLSSFPVEKLAEMNSRL